MAHWNRWFTVLDSMVDLSMAIAVNVITKITVDGIIWMKKMNHPVPTIGAMKGERGIPWKNHCWWWKNGGNPEKPWWWYTIVGDYHWWSSTPQVFQWDMDSEVCVNWCGSTLCGTDPPRCSLKWPKKVAATAMMAPLSHGISWWLNGDLIGT